MAKVYTKGTTVVDEVLSGAERYDIKENAGTAFKSNMQIVLATSVATPGTGINAARLNNIETGIDALDTKVADANDLLTTGGTTTAYTLTTTGAAALATGERFRVKFNATAGATPTLNRDSKGAKSLKYYDSTGAKVGCTSSNIVANLITDVVYDGTDYVVLDPAGVGGLNTDGWNAVTWSGLARVSDFVFETTTDITGIIQKGYKLKYTDTTTKYLPVISVSAYTGGKTTITCATNSDYKFVGAPSAIYWSNVESPFGWPEWFNVTAPTFDVSMMDNGAGGQPTTTDCRISIKGKMLNMHYKGNGTKAGTAWYFAFSAANFPTPANYGTSAVLGYCNAGWSGRDMSGTVKIISGSFYLVFDEDRSITDNQVVTAYSCNLGYEI